MIVNLSCEMVSWFRHIDFSSEFSATFLMLLLTLNQNIRIIIKDKLKHNIITVNMLFHV